MTLRSQFERTHVKRNGRKRAREKAARCNGLRTTGVEPRCPTDICEDKQTPELGYQQFASACTISIFTLYKVVMLPNGGLKV